MPQTKPSTLPLTTSSCCSTPFHSLATQTRKPRRRLFLQDISDSFTMLAILPNTCTTLTSLCLDYQTWAASSLLGAHLHGLLRHAEPARNARLNTPYLFTTQHLHPWECQQPSVPGKRPQAHSKASSNVTILLPSSLRLSEWCSFDCEQATLHPNQARQHF